ncbi:hypothetical protein ACQUQU_02980 [Thalassolituus sp. LLYu03]|uniref:hypothetical protein n=1 Tax=Thalassolituus sp. LLYu03 TaxID=3421656 RepID=UPI003D2D9D43
MILLFLAMTLAGCVVLYLSHPNQRWLVLPLRSLLWRWAGLALLIGGLLAAVSYLPVNAALFAWLVIMMLVIGLLPFASLLIIDRGRREHP